MYDFVVHTLTGCPNFVKCLGSWVLRQ